MHIFLFYIILVLGVSASLPACAQDDSEGKNPQTQSVVENKADTSAKVLSVSINELEIKDIDGISTAYDKKGQLFSGIAEIPNKNGDVVSYTYRNGLKDGVALLKFPSGKTQRQEMYQKGQLNGEAYTFDENGNVLHVETYRDGVKEGRERIVEDNILREENFYQNGKLSGTSKKYNTKYLTDEINYQNGIREGLHIQYKENGSKIEIPYVNGEKQGKAVAYYPDQKIAQTENYLHNTKDGMSRKYSKSGILRVAENYKNDQLDGISRFFDERGVLQQVWHYVEGVKTAEVNIEQNKDLKDIQEAYENGMLNKYLDQKQFWYPILWLGLNAEKEEILNDLASTMKMYGENIDDLNVYKRESKTKYADYEQNLYFGLSPLGYAVSIDLPVGILQKITETGLTQKGSKGTTALEDAIAMHKPEAVKYLLTDKALVEAGDLLLAIRNHAPAEIVNVLLEAGADVHYLSAEGVSAAYLAVEQKNEEIIPLLAEYGADFSQPLPDGKNILLSAYEKNISTDVLAKVLKNISDVNVTDVHKTPLLLKSLEDERYDVAAMLLQKGADVNQTNQKGESALSYCVKKPTVELCRNMILQNSANAGNVKEFEQPLWKIALAQNDLELLRKIWDQSDITKPDTNGEVPLKTVLLSSGNSAAEDLALSYVQEVSDELVWDILKAQNLSVFTKIMRKKLNTAITDPHGNTLLMYIIAHGYPIAYVQAMPVNGLQINNLNTDGSSALSMAVVQNNPELVRFLVENGADINQKIKDVPLVYTLKAEQSDIAAILVQKGADLTYLPTDGSSGLMQAVRQMNIPLIEALSADQKAINARDKYGRTALLYLMQALDEYKDMTFDETRLYWSEIIRILKDRGADINAQDGNGETLLIQLAKKHADQYEKWRDLLIDAGIDAHLKDQYRKTAEDYFTQLP